MSVSRPLGALQSSRAPVAASLLFTIGLALLFFGERVWQDAGVARAVCSGVGGAAVVVSVAFRWWAAARLRNESKTAERAMALLCTVGAGAVLVYFLTVEPAASWIGLDSLAPVARQRWEAILTVAWVIAWLVSFTTLWFGEIALWPMRDAAHVEWRRVRSAMLAGFTLAAAAGYASVFVYVAGKLDLRADYSYFKTATPSDSTIAMTRHLTEPVKVVAFFPPVNDVRDEAMAYLRQLQRKAPAIEVEEHDRLVSPELAEKARVANDGVIAIMRETQTETIDLGLQMNRARAKLRNLDGEMQRALGKVLRNRRTAYLTVGHGELNDTQRAGSTEGRTAQGVRELLQMHNYDVRDLGMVQGLGRRVPRDANLVLVLGPREPLAKAEVASLVRYAEGGGSLLLALEPETKASNAELAAIVGLTYQGDVLCHAEQHGIRRRNPSDRSIIFSNRFVRHDAVATLNRWGTRAVFFLGSGALDVAASVDPDLVVSFVLNSLPGTWADTNANFTFDQPDERMAIYKLVAAVEHANRNRRDRSGSSDSSDSSGDSDLSSSDRVDGAAPANSTNPAAEQPSGLEEEARRAAQDRTRMRAVVTADVDALSDAALMNPSEFNGNLQFVVDAIRWLGGDEAEQGSFDRGEDVRIEHTKQADRAYFYLTIFGVPVAVLAAGLWLSRRRRGANESSESNEKRSP